MNRRTHNHIVFTKTISGAFLALCLFLGGSTAKGAWQDDANDRIEQNRKRNAQITVVDMNGQPVHDISVQIEQVNHSFAFGTALSYSNVLNNTTYKNFVLNHFNWAVCENETKWGSNEPTQGNVTYTQADYIYNWCNTNGIKMRGHCLFWEQNNSNMPSWVPNLPYATYPTSSALLSAVDSRINSAVNHFKDKFHNWDVDNEMLTDSTFTSRLGSGGIVHMFNAAKATDTNCGMFMNEYSGNSFGGYDAGPYVTRANSLISQGATIDGYGIQAHVNSPFDPESYWTNVLKRLGVQGKPIWATEFDTDTTNDAQRAADLYNFYLICFSDPNVAGIMQWGFMVGTTWRASGAWGIVSSSGTLNAAGTAYEALMNRWTTNDANYTDPNGKVNFRGFHGSYEITLSAPGQTTEVHAIELTPGTTDVQFTL
ncbi:MAG: endo-1,4-beta-xylanase, partial [Sedimentisphaerales bacterium]